MPRRTANRLSRTDDARQHPRGQILLSLRDSDFLAVAAYTIMLAVFGGGLVTWSAGYALLTVCTIAFAVLFVWRDGLRTVSKMALPGRVALVGIAVLPLLQLIPLPPAMWQALPGQELRLATLTQAGLAATWQPLSLEPFSTALIAILAIGFVTLVASLLRLSDSAFRAILQVVVAVVILGIAVGLLQVVSGGQPNLQVTNMGNTMLGFFANKNHMAIALACSILIFGMVVSKDLFARRQRRVVTLGYTGFMLICIVTTNSRAGLALGALAAAIVLADLARGVALRWRMLGIGALVLLLGALLSTSAFVLVSNRVGDVSKDLRWQIATWSWPLAKQYGVLGSGLGSFTTLFAAHEELTWVKPTIVNAAHNDYLQLLIETGLTGVVLLVLLAVAVGRAAWLCWVTPRTGARSVEMVMGLSIIMLFALHSGFDYPLRRPAAWIFFAIAVATAFRAASVANPVGVASHPVYAS